MEKIQKISLGVGIVLLVSLVIINKSSVSDPLALLRVNILLGIAVFILRIFAAIFAGMIASKINRVVFFYSLFAFLSPGFGLILISFIKPKKH